MFFSIDFNPQDNFSYFYQLGDFTLSTDAGWRETVIDNNQIVYKGYADQDHLIKLLPAIISQTQPYLIGNFCVIVHNKNTGDIKIKTDKYRGFPIFIGNKKITNLTCQESTAWSDDIIEIDCNFNIIRSKFDVIGDICLDPIDLNECINKIDKILNQRTTSFLLHNTLPIKAYLSGGVDSALVYSYLQKYTKQYELLKCNHIDYDEFWLKNSGTLQKNFWGYKQIHHWTTPGVLTSGAPGDEFMLRSPTTSDLLLKFHGMPMTKLLESANWKNCLHYTYFHKDANYKIFQEQQLDTNWAHQDLIWNLCNIVVNDWQHWHLGNTLTWAPLRDLDIFKLLLRLPIDVLLTQIMDSAISIELIENNFPGLSKIISDQKNSGNQFKNLCDFLLG